MSDIDSDDHLEKDDSDFSDVSTTSASSDQTTKSCITTRSCTSTNSKNKNKTKLKAKDFTKESDKPKVVYEDFTQYNTIKNVVIVAMDLISKTQPGKSLTKALNKAFIRIKLLNKATKTKANTDSQTSTGLTTSQTTQTTPSKTVTSTETQTSTLPPPLPPRSTELIKPKHQTDNLQYINSPSVNLKLDLQPEFTLLNNRLQEIKDLQNNLNDALYRQETYLKENIKPNTSVLPNEENSRENPHEDHLPSTSTTTQNTPTYMQKLLSPTSPRNIPSQQQRTQNIFTQAQGARQQSRRIIHVTSQSQQDSGRQVMDILRTYHVSTQAQIAFTKIFRSAVDVHCKTETDAKTLTQELNTNPEIASRLKVSEKLCPPMRILLMGVPADMEAEQLQQRLHDITGTHNKESTIQILRKQHSKIPNTNNWILHMPTPLAEAFLALQSVQLGLFKCFLRPYTEISRCSNCQALNHTVHTCTNNVYCSHCSGGHKNDKCNLRPSCINCQRENSNRRKQGLQALPSKHPAYSLSCPILEDMYSRKRDFLNKKYPITTNPPTAPQPENTRQQTTNKNTRIQPNNSNKRTGSSRGRRQNRSTSRRPPPNTTNTQEQSLYQTTPAKTQQPQQYETQQYNQRQNARSRSRPNKQGTASCNPPNWPYPYMYGPPQMQFTGPRFFDYEPQVDREEMYFQPPPSAYYTQRDQARG